MQPSEAAVTLYLPVMFLALLSVLYPYLVLILRYFSCSYVDDYECGRFLSNCLPVYKFYAFDSQPDVMPYGDWPMNRAAIVALRSTGLKLDTATRRLIMHYGLVRRGCRAGVHRQRGRSRAAACPVRCVTAGRDDVSREIPVVTGFRSFVYKQSVPRARTLVSIPLGDRINNNYDFTKFGLVNARSVANKTAVLSNYIPSEVFDVLSSRTHGMNAVNQFH